MTQVPFNNPGPRSLSWLYCSSIALDMTRLEHTVIGRSERSAVINHLQGSSHEVREDRTAATILGGAVLYSNPLRRISVENVARPVFACYGGLVGSSDLFKGQSCADNRQGRSDT